MLQVVDYVAGSVIVKTIMNKATGSVKVYSFDRGKALTDKGSPFDTLLEVIDGTGEVVIDVTSHLVQCGESIIIPGHARYIIRANSRFKMIRTIIKSVY